MNIFPCTSNLGKNAVAKGVVEKVLRTTPCFIDLGVMSELGDPRTSSLARRGGRAENAPGQIVKGPGDCAHYPGMTSCSKSILLGCSVPRIRVLKIPFIHWL